MTNPSIAPPLMSCPLAHWLCGPPWSYSPVSWYGFQHVPWSSFTHTENEPSGLRGIPFAPGNVPKYESNERFSWTTKMKWLMLSMPSLGSIGRASAAETVTAAAFGRRVPAVVAARVGHDEERDHADHQGGDHEGGEEGALGPLRARHGPGW